MAYATSTYLALAAAAAAAGGQYYNTQQTAKHQDNQLAAQLRQQQANQDKANAQVNQTIAQRAASNDDGERQTTLDQYLTATRANQGAATAGLQQAGATSNAYKTSGADASLGIADYGSKIANLMSRIDAPNQQRQREALESAQLGSNLGLLGRQAQGDDFLAQLKLRGITRNPWIDAGSQLLGGVAGGLASSAGTTAATGASGWGAFGSSSPYWVGAA
jgi:hypothetical protein